MQASTYRKLKEMRQKKCGHGHGGEIVGIPLARELWNITHVKEESRGIDIILTIEVDCIRLFKPDFAEDASTKYDRIELEDCHSCSTSNIRAFHVHQGNRRLYRPRISSMLLCRYRRRPESSQTLHWQAPEAAPDVSLLR